MSKKIFSVLSLAFPLFNIITLILNIFSYNIPTFCLLVVSFLWALGFLPGILFGVIEIILFIKNKKSEAKISYVYLVLSIIGLALNILWSIFFYHLIGNAMMSV